MQCDKDLIMHWIEALEKTSSHMQCRGRLRRGRLLCALGLGCDLLDFGYWDKDDAFSLDRITYDIGRPPPLVSQLYAWDLDLTRREAFEACESVFKTFTASFISVEQILYWHAAKTLEDFICFLNDNGFTFHNLAVFASVIYYRKGILPVNRYDTSRPSVKEEGLA